MHGAEYLPFAERGAYSPDTLSAFYAHLRQQDHAGFVDERTGYHVVHRYQDVGQLLKGHSVVGDTPDSAIDNSTTLDPYVSKARIASNPACWQGLANLVRYTTPATANAAGETHRIVKRAVYDGESLTSLNRSFTERNYGLHVERVAQLSIQNLKQQFESQEVVDLSEAFVRPYVTNVIAKVVGFEGHDDEIKEWSDAQSALLGRDLSRKELSAAISGLGGLARACHDLALSRRLRPQKDLTSLMVGPKHHLEPVLAGSTIMNLIAAGYATTYGTLLNSMRYLSTSQGRHHWDRLDEAGYNKVLVPELTRMETGLVGWRRKAAHAIELSDGSFIEAGRNILLLIGAANRDAVFESPDTFDVTRARTPQQLSFGRGPHLCMGRELANLEMGVALRALRRAFPTLRVLPTAEIQYDPDMLFRTPQELPVIR